MSDETPTAAAVDWRTDPRWHLIASDPAYWRDKEPPVTPPPAAELAQPDCWASLYATGFKEPVATWAR